MKIDVFVSYHADSARKTAEAVVNKLEQQGLRCWYQDRDTGGRFAGGIKRAIDQCGAFVVILNQAASESPHVLNEVALAFDRRDVAILPLRIADEELSDDMEYYLHRIHWIDAVNRSLDAALDDLCRRTLQALNMTAPKAKIETINYKDGCVYTGEILNGKRHGKGKMVWPSGDIYEGDWRGDQRNGKGKYVWPDGAVYEGDLVNGKIQGKGKKIWPSGDIYEGDWRDDQCHGKGKQWWPNGDRYEGDFINNQRTGKGKYWWPNGDRYEGDFVNSERTGIGTYTYADGRVSSGLFLKGVFQG